LEKDGAVRVERRIPALGLGAAGWAYVRTAAWACREGEDTILVVAGSEKQMGQRLHLVYDTLSQPSMWDVLPFRGCR